MRQALVFLCMCFGVQGMKGTSNSTLGSLPAKERNRRLIPYMTYYLGQPQNSQYKQQVGLPYVPVQQYKNIPQRYIPQSTPLTRMITQNYLAMMKQIQQVDPRQQQRIVNPSPPGDLKYYVQIPAPQQNILQIPESQFLKNQNQNAPQYVKTVNNDEQYLDDNYYLREQEPTDQNYAKPPADSILQYVKPEVQQYVAKLRGAIQYPKQEQVNYDKNVPQVQYVTKTEAPQQYTGNLETQQYTQKQEGVVYGPKQIIRIIPNTPAKFIPQPSVVPEYITKPIVNPFLQYPKATQQSVSILQSQEIDVQSLPTTPAPKYHSTYVAKPVDDLQYEQPTYEEEQQTVEDLDSHMVDKNLNEVLQGLSLSKSLPERITNENLGSSIKTLSKILRILQRAQTLPHSVKGFVRLPKPTEVVAKPPKIKIPTSPSHDEGSTPGRPGIDYPNYDEIPPTHFSCKTQRYKGFFGDPETGCQVWHYCDLNGGQASFLCPNGTIFSQQALTCDWWFNVKCATTPQLYVLNERLYKYILPQKPSFPEDYSGPVVDRYLTQKFQEIEEKNKNKTEEHKDESTEDEDEPPFSIDPISQNKVRSVS